VDGAFFLRASQDGEFTLQSFRKALRSGVASALRNNWFARQVSRVSTGFRNDIDCRQNGAVRLLRIVGMITFCC